MNELKGQVCFASGKSSDYDIWPLDLETGEINQLTFGSYWNDKPHWVDPAVSRSSSVEPFAGHASAKA